MGSTSASVKGGALETALDEVKLASTTRAEYEGLERAMRAAVETVVRSNPAVQKAIADEVEIQIIDRYKAAKRAGQPWPFR
jgi:hypothetical protein